MKSRRGDICIPHSEEEREQPTSTPIDLEAAEQEIGLRAYRPPPDPLLPGSFQSTHQDLHGIREAFDSGDPDVLNLARPPYAKQPSDRVLHELWDWEQDQTQRLDSLLQDPVYRFLETLSTHAHVDIEELLIDTRKGRPGFQVGRELQQRQQAAQFGVTPEPGAVPQGTQGTQEQSTRQGVRFAEPLLRQERRTQRRRQRGRESVGLPSSAPVKRLKTRADLSRPERLEAWDARAWLEQVTVMGRFIISGRARTAINYNYTRIIGNVARLNGVHVKHFMFSEHVSQLFAQLCGLYLNYLDFLSRRTYIEISMNNVYIRNMANLICVFGSSVLWDGKKLLFEAGGARRAACTPTLYCRTDGCTPTTMSLSLCRRRGRSSTAPLYLTH